MFVIDIKKMPEPKKKGRIPRKKGQPVGSKKHSDLYTDENPKDTVSIKYATVQDARDTVKKEPFARLIQILTVMEQRAKASSKPRQAEIARRGKDAIRKKFGRIK